MPVVLDRSEAAPMRVRVTATASNVGRLRRRLRCWLADVTDDADVVDDLCLAASEALENAVDHAFAHHTVGSVTLEAHHDVGPSAVVVSVIDDGHWQPPSQPGYRGRGLALIDQLSSTHHLGAGPHGTRITFRRDL